MVHGLGLGNGMRCAAVVIVGCEIDEAATCRGEVAALVLRDPEPRDLVIEEVRSSRVSVPLLFRPQSGVLCNLA